MDNIKYLINNNLKIAYRKTPADSNLSLLYLHGMQAVMGGKKSDKIKKWAEEHRLSFIEMDYSGHGLSEGSIADCTVSDWLSDAEQVFLHSCKNNTILSASSLGCWIAVLLAEKYPEKIKALHLLSPAVDLDRFFYQDKLSELQRQIIKNKGFIEILRPEYDTVPLIITKQMIVNCKNHKIYGRQIQLSIPISITHSLQDQDISYHSATLLFKQLQSSEKHLRILPSGSHNLSEEKNLRDIHKDLSSLKKAAKI